MSSLSNLLIPAVLFFALGVIARLIKSDLKFPPDLGKVLSIYLLMAIGLHGGYHLSKAELSVAMEAILWALILGFGLPVIGYLALIATRKVGKMDAAAISAHYGSVSAGTFLTAIAFLDSSNIEYESYPLIMLAVMESPAIIVGLILAALARKQLKKEQSSAPQDEDDSQEGGQKFGHLIHEALTNGSVVILIGSMIIGSIAQPESIDKLKPFIDEIFMGVLCLFLFEMGMEAARRIKEFKKVGIPLALFGIIMPVFGGFVGATIGHNILEFSIGGSLLVAILGASASYIAVPPAMRLAVPEANPSFYLTLSLGITFPFNVVVGIPLYFSYVKYLAGV